MNKEIIEEVRKSFPVLERRVDDRPIVYLDSAATTLKPKSVVKAVTDYYEEYCSNIHRGKHMLSEIASNRYEQSRYLVSLFLNCQGNEIVFVKNTTEALNLVASGLSLEKEDLVIGFLNSHHSNILPWRRHGTLELVKIDESGQVDMEHYRLLLKKNPKVVAITHCSNVSGAYVPLKEMTELAKEAGALVVVDAAQSLPHKKIDLSKIPIDFLAASAHKMLGPTGIGCLFGRHELLNSLQPLNWGGGMVDWVDFNVEKDQLRKIPHRFEAGTPPIEGAIGFAAALDYLEDLGEDFIETHDFSMSQRLLNAANSRSYIQALGPKNPENKAAILSFRINGCSDHGEVAKILSDSFGVMCRTGHLCSQPYVDSTGSGEVLRASAYLYNTTEEIDYFFESLDQIVNFVT